MTDHPSVRELAGCRRAPCISPCPEMTEHINSSVLCGRYTESTGKERYSPWP
jgi:hypothetical protein